MTHISDTFLPSEVLLLKNDSVVLSLDQILLAASVDRLSVLIWQKTKDGQKNRNRPKSVVDTLLGDKKKDELEVFENEAAFEEWYRKTRT